MRPTVIRYNKITFTPHWTQLVVNELPTIVLFICGFLYSGLFLPLRSIVGLVTCILFLRVIFRYLYLLSVKFHVSGEQLIYERGLVRHKVDYIELYRIVDFNESQSFIQRLFGTKTVVIHSGDRTTPTLKMIGMQKPEDIVGIIRERVEYNKQRKGIYEITNR